MFAPSTEGQFGEGITFESWRNALKEVGFTDLVEVGLGGDMTAYAEAAEWAEAYRDGKKMTTSCCPGFVNLIRLHYPDLLDHIPLDQVERSGGDHCFCWSVHCKEERSH